MQGSRILSLNAVAGVMVGLKCDRCVIHFHVWFYLRIGFHLILEFGKQKFFKFVCKRSCLGFKRCSKMNPAIRYIILNPFYLSFLIHFYLQDSNSFYR